MQLIDGVTLKELLRYDEMPADRCLGLLEQSAGALDTAPRAGLVHRDIKPQNIRVAAGDRAYLADFGLTRLATDSGLTKTGQFVGTVDYIAPRPSEVRPDLPRSIDAVIATRQARAWRTWAGGGLASYQGQQVANKVDDVYMQIAFGESPPTG